MAIVNEKLLIYLWMSPEVQDLCKICDHFFGEPPKGAGSHRVYKTPWHGDPRINIQNHKGKAKAYQVKQVLLALEKLEVSYGITK